MALYIGSYVSGVFKLLSGTIAIYGFALKMRNNNQGDGEPEARRIHNETSMDTLMSIVTIWCSVCLGIAWFIWYGVDIIRFGINDIPDQNGLSLQPW